NKKSFKLTKLIFYGMILSVTFNPTINVFGQELNENVEKSNEVNSPYEQGDDAVGWDWRGRNMEWVFRDHFNSLLNVSLKNMEIGRFPDNGIYIIVPVPQSGGNMISHNGRSYYDIDIARMDWGTPSLNTGDSSLTGEVTLENGFLNISLRKNKNAVIDSKKIKLKLNVPRLDSTVYVDKGWTDTFQYFARQAESTIDLNVKIDNSYELLKNINLKLGEKFEPNMPFDLVTNYEGKSLLFSDPSIKHYLIDGVEANEIDTSKPGYHTVQIGVEQLVKDGDAYKKEIRMSNKVTVKVSGDVKLKLKDVECSVGDTFDPTSIFDEVVDSFGNPIKLDNENLYFVLNDEDVYTGKNLKLDTSKPAEHKISLLFLEGGDLYTSNEVTVSIKENKMSLKTKDSSLYVGQTWNPQDNFISATDEWGNDVLWGDNRLTYKDNVDVEVPGEYKVTFTYKGTEKEITQSATVTVSDIQ
ncbi:bacterial Ig-like domain-containing protein, partial [Enterococcus faecalis]|nr:bacterial Ig-like domain-containing protein [Enterococcus faecalis]